MRFGLDLEINVPRDCVVGLFLDPDNLKKWQPDLVSLKQIGGDAPRAVGAKWTQVHKMGGRDVEMIETILTHNYPEEFSATYEADGIWNLIENRFLEVGSDKTKWLLDADFKCSGFVLRLMTLFAPGMFRRQTKTFMDRFKAFAEAESA